MASASKLLILSNITHHTLLNIICIIHWQIQLNSVFECVISARSVCTQHFLIWSHNEMWVIGFFPHYSDEKKTSARKKQTNTQIRNAKMSLKRYWKREWAQKEMMKWTMRMKDLLFLFVCYCFFLCVCVFVLCELMLPWLRYNLEDLVRIKFQCGVYTMLFACCRHL